ncbi:MAG TPA: hypothetical protein VG900_01110 [Hyphomicrobiaceae bacterium]|jgi:hypothetical protein|nr:hypothetical protein [Hyphomicrobiaceae bacterium]
MLRAFLNSQDFIEAASTIAVFAVVTIAFYLAHARRERQTAQRRWQDDLRAWGA